MPAWDDPAAYLADFGVPCVAGAVSFPGILSAADDVIELPRAAVHSRSYELVYRTAAVLLVRGGALTVDGAAFTVREPPRQVDDGVFSVAILSKV